ncbi:hypothetical protein CYMTET_23036, partial [Cymbomonas tetramitiformis]
VGTGAPGVTQGCSNQLGHSNPLFALEMGDSAGDWAPSSEDEDHFYLGSGAGFGPSKPMVSVVNPNMRQVNEFVDNHPQVIASLTISLRDMTITDKVSCVHSWIQANPATVRVLTPSDLSTIFNYLEPELAKNPSIAHHLAMAIRPGLTCDHINAAMHAATRVKDDVAIQMVPFCTDFDEGGRKMILDRVSEEKRSMAAFKFGTLR